MRMEVKKIKLKSLNQKLESYTQVFPGQTQILTVYTVFALDSDMVDSVNYVCKSSANSNSLPQGNTRTGGKVSYFCFN